MNAKLIKFVVFLSYFVNALVVENNGDGLNVYETTWKNPFDGGIENLKKAEIFEKKENEQQSFDSKKNDKKIKINAEDLKDQPQETIKVSLDHQNYCEASKQCIPNTPYFKHFLMQFTQLMEPVGESEYYVAQVRISGFKFNRLQKLLSQENSEKELLDIITESFEHLPHSAYGFSWGDTFNNLIWPGLLMLCGLCMTFIIYFIVSSWDMFAWRRNIVIVIFCCFLLSIPWEWFRMYKSALSKKTAASLKDIPPECSPNKMTAWNSIRLWLKDHFSTESDQCAIYHEAILVDPIWEVSPLMATSACLSRFFVEPLKHLAATSGECFKLFFREIPVQWQPIVFIAVLLLLIVSIISFSGFQVSTPLLSIGSKNTDASKITTYEGKIYSLEATNKLLQKKLVELEKRGDFKYIDNVSFDEHVIEGKPKKYFSSVTSGFDRKKLKATEQHASKPSIRNIMSNENSVNCQVNNEAIEPIFVDNDNRESRACETEWSQDAKQNLNANRAVPNSVSQSARIVPFSINSSFNGRYENISLNSESEIAENLRENNFDNDYILVDQ